MAKDNNNNSRNIQTPSGMQMTINLNTLDYCICPNCQNGYFTPIYNLKMIPPLLTPTGQPGIAQIERGYLCTNCGAICETPVILASLSKELPSIPSISKDDLDELNKGEGGQG
jgi:hypothetical protein